jgi:hypothetical protein
MRQWRSLKSAMGDCYIPVSSVGWYQVSSVVFSLHPGTVKFPALIEESAGDPDKQHDERVSDGAREKTEEHGN